MRMKDFHRKGERMTYEEAIALLRSFKIEPGHDWDRHCIGVGEIAYRLALEIQKYRMIDPEQVRVMGLVHDFGRSVSQDPYRHAYEGYKLMKEFGKEEYARICVCHSNGTYKEEDLEAYGLKPEDFYVRTLEEKLVFIGDSLESKGRIIRHEVRIAQTIERYRDKNPKFIPVLEGKLEEFKTFDREVSGIIGKSVYAFFGI